MPKAFSLRMQLLTSIASTICWSQAAAAQSAGQTASEQPTTTPAQPQAAATTASNNNPAAESNSPDMQGEIVVTANKRAERIKDVALSISAVTGQELQRRQVQDIQDLARTVPGISFIRSGSIAGNGNQIIIRGLNTGFGGATVASVVDDAPLSFSVTGASFASDFEPWDLDRIEVLRGPQGSLYGATAEGGLIKYVTQAPDLGRVGAGFDVGLLTLAHASEIGGSAKGWVNVPLGTEAGLRVSGYYTSSPGWIDNHLGHQKDANGFKRYGGRATLLLKPTERLTIRGTALLQTLKSNGFDAIEVHGLADPSNQFAPLHGYNLDTFLPQPSNSKAQLYIGSVGYDFDSVGVQSITSYGRMRNFRTNDVPLYGQVFGGLLFGRPNTTLFYEINANLDKFSQEFRVFSQNDAAKVGHGLQWQVGAFYTHETIENHGNYYTRDQTTGARVTTPFGPASPRVLQADTNQRYRELAAYLDATYFFSPQFDVEAGGRIFGNKQRQSGVQGGPFLGVPLGTLVPEVRSQETSWTFAVAPRYHFNRDVMLYGRIATGYRPGGPQNFIPNAPPNLPTQFGSDKTINYEVGTKGTAFNRMLSFDVAAFYVDWKDVQITVSYPLGGVAFNVTGNAGHAVSKGVEWTFALNPVRGLNLTWIGAYTDARLTQDAPGIGGFKDDRLPYIPKLSTTLTANYRWHVGNDVSAFVGGSFTHQSGQFTSYTLTPQISHLPIPGYDTLAAELGINKGRYGILLYGKNLTDKRGITYYYPGQSALGGTIPAQTGLIRPRELGIRLTGTF